MSDAVQLDPVIALSSLILNCMVQAHAIERSFYLNEWTVNLHCRFLVDVPIFNTQPRTTDGKFRAANIIKKFCLNREMNLIQKANLFILFVPTIVLSPSFINIRRQPKWKPPSIPSAQCGCFLCVARLFFFLSFFFHTAVGQWSTDAPKYDTHHSRHTLYIRYIYFIHYT